MESNKKHTENKNLIYKDKAHEDRNACAQFMGLVLLKVTKQKHKQENQKHDTPSIWQKHSNKRFEQETEEHECLGTIETMDKVAGEK